MEGNVAERMRDTMVVVTGDKLAAGEHAEAVKLATNFIQSIEGHEPHVRRAFAPALFKLYSIRARARMLLGTVAAAEDDVRRALGALEGAVADSSALEKLRQAVPSVLAPDSAVARASLELVTQTPVAAAADVARPAPPAPAAGSRSRGLRVSSAEARLYGLFFLLGTAYWAVPGLFITGAIPLPSGDAGKFGVGLVMAIGVGAAWRGWNWFSQYKFGTIGSLLKWMAVFLIGLTVIGLVPVFFWTGRGLLRWAGKAE